MLKSAVSGLSAHLMYKVYISFKASVLLQEQSILACWGLLDMERSIPTCQPAESKSLSGATFCKAFSESDFSGARFS